MTYRTLTYTILTLVIAFAATSVYAQDGAGTGADASGEPAQNDALEAARARGGDVLIMKSGAILGGVQILRSSPLNYYVELLPGMEPMVIPRRQVTKVEYDDIDPLRERRRRKSVPKPEDELMADGKELDPDFVEKLRKPIPGAPLEFNREDYVRVFAELSKKTKVVIVIDESLRLQPPATRLWTIKITPEMRLMDILQKKWAETFKSGKVTYELNKVVLKNKEAEAAATAQPNSRPVIKLGN